MRQVAATIGIVTVVDDVHAFAIERELVMRHGARCARIALDQLAGAGRLSWSPDAAEDARLPTVDGGHVVLGDLDAAWFRRMPKSQILPDHLDAEHRDLYDGECPAAALGALHTGFRGVWVSDPHRTRISSGKLVQLQAARAAGLRIPNTLVSSEPEAIRGFVRSQPTGAIVKRVSGNGRFIEAARVHDDVLADDDVLSAMPAIYQEAIDGTVHIRAHIFGERVLAAMLVSEDLDWRSNLDVPWQIYDVDATTSARLRATQRALGLDMGVYDLKITPEGEPVFLEVNPQGQFLFVEGITGLPLTASLAEHLVARATNPADLSRAA